MDEIIKTISSSSEGLFKDKGSKHFGFVFPIKDEEEAKEKLYNLKSKHQKANHHCYGFRLKTGNKLLERYSDDGEPNNSAGLPIFNQLQKHELINVMAVVVRYFGGTKLGVGGLINAYRSATEIALENATFSEEVTKSFLKISVNFSEISLLNQTLKQNRVSILNEAYAEKYSVKVLVSHTEALKLKSILSQINNCTIFEI